MWSRTRIRLALGALITIGTVTLLVVSAAPASSSQPSVTARPFAAMLGVVPAAHRDSAAPHRPSANDVAGTSFASGANLIYHGGQVLHSNQTYAIYWGSALSSTYRTLIGGFFQNVAADSGKTTNVYSTATQYGDGAGLIAYSSSFGGAYVDTSTPIPDHCSSEYTGTGITPTGCVTDGDIQAEVSHAISAAGWTAGPNKIFFVFTPPSVGSCYDATTNTCAYSQYCAYHSWFVDSGSAEVFYTNQPYADSSAIGAPGACDSGQHPNNDWADATINVTSHEHLETISDPDGRGWYDSSGNEMADKCVWTFGSPIGSTTAGAFNQAIGSGMYYLQREWSNATGTCVLAYGGALPTVTGFSPKKGSPGDSVFISGTNFEGATAVAFGGIPASFTITSGTGSSRWSPWARRRLPSV